MTDQDELARDATAEAVEASVAAYGQPPAEPEHQHGAGAASVREAAYRGHTIVIRTTYEIEIDGKPLEAHIGVNNSGQVHYHGVPNNSFKSAVDLIKHIIDAFPDDFPAPPATGGHGAGHGHDH